MSKQLKAIVKNIDKWLDDAFCVDFAWYPYVCAGTTLCSTKYKVGRIAFRWHITERAITDLTVNTFTANLCGDDQSVPSGPL